MEELPYKVNAFHSIFCRWHVSKDQPEFSICFIHEVFQSRCPRLDNRDVQVMHIRTLTLKVYGKAQVSSLYDQYRGRYFKELNYYVSSLKYIRVRVKISALIHYSLATPSTRPSKAVFQPTLRW